MPAGKLTRVEPVDLVIGLAFTLALQVEIWAPHLLGADADLVQRPMLSVLSLGISLPLVARRTAPWAAALVALTCEALMGRADTPPEGLANLAAMLLIAYSLGRHAPRPRGYAGILPILVCSMIVGEEAADRAFVAIVMGAAWGAGVLVGRRSDDVAGPGAGPPHERGAAAAGRPRGRGGRAAPHRLRAARRGRPSRVDDRGPEPGRGRAARRRPGGGPPGGAVRRGGSAGRRSPSCARSSASSPRSRPRDRSRPTSLGWATWSPTPAEPGSRSPTRS